MSHTKRSYQNPNYRGRGKWWFGWIHEIGKPWKELTNEILVDHKEEGISKKLISKRRRWQNKMELKEIWKNYTFFLDNSSDLELYDEDPLSHLIPVWDAYQNSLNPLYGDDYYYD